ncbi:MAG: hydrogenase expression/formation protein HypE [Natronomonas sp.]|jgi:hydrogenase expression/formation protein HypE|uniref:AIR synthase family protein n=1 Tax=Natronomonas sp. TaxID=2184060 RepID=UPI00398993CB
MDTGKVSRAFFEERIAPNLGGDRDDVAIGPKHGVDFGVISVGDHALVTATDPISILPELGWERAGRFAISIVLSDVAVSGLAPTHLTISFSLPPEMSDEAFGQVWDAIDAECRDLGISVVTGHTARYEGCSFPWVGAATGMAVGDPADIVRPDGARPGDDLLVTKGPAVESVGLLTTLFEEKIELPPETLSTAQARLDETGAVRDALTAAAAGDVHAMHDATEGGLLGALHEVAGSAGVQLTVDGDRVPVRPGVEAACAALEMDAWRASTSGTLVIAVDSADTDRVVDALETRGTPVGVIGTVEAGSGVVLDGEATAQPEGDSGWPVYERLLDS